MQHSVFTHGTALEIETPQTLLHYRKFGWGTQVTFKEPVAGSTGGLPHFEEVGPGSWFHLPLTSTLPSSRTTRLKGATILFDSTHCRIDSVHVYDGAWIIKEFNGLTLKGGHLSSRNQEDVDAGISSYGSEKFPNTLNLKTPHEVFSAIGLSFHACAYFEDFNHHGRTHRPEQDGPFPPAVLIVGAAGAQYIVEDPPSVTITVGKLLGGTSVIVGP